MELPLPPSGENVPNILALLEASEATNFYQIFTNPSKFIQNGKVSMKIIKNLDCEHTENLQGANE